MANDYDLQLCTIFLALTFTSFKKESHSKKVEDKNLIEFWDSSEIFPFSPTPTSRSEEQSFLYSTEIFLVSKLLDPMFEAKSHKS